jgi:hypothetical protein
MMLYNFILLIVGAVAGSGFIGGYWFTHPKWYTSNVGKLLMAFSINIFLFYSWYILVAFWPSIPGRGLVRTVLFTMMTVSLVYRLVKFVQIEAKLRRTNAASDVRRSDGGEHTDLSSNGSGVH